jgi:cell division septation protein DedD
MTAGAPVIRVTAPGLALAILSLATAVFAWVLLGGGTDSGPASGPPPSASQAPPSVTDVTGKPSIFDDDPAAKRGAGSASVAGGASAPPAVPASGAGAFAVQVFQGDEKAARTLARNLEGKGYRISVLPGDSRNRARVRVTGLADRAAADAAARRLEKEERLPTWVVPSSAP